MVYSTVVKYYFRNFITLFVLFVSSVWMVTPLYNYYLIMKDQEVYLNFKLLYKNFFEYFDMSMFRLFLLVLLIIIFSCLFLLIFFEITKLKNETINGQIKFLFFINYFILFFTLLLLIHCNHLLSLLFCIEIINIILYFIISLQNKLFMKNNISNSIVTEIILKYFIHNAFFTFIYLFGTSLIYTKTKNMNFHSIGIFLFENISVLNHPITLLGIFFIICSFFIKLGFLGFHKLIYEVYNGFNYYVYNFIGIFLKFFFFNIFAIMFIDAFSMIYSTKLFFIVVFFTICSLLLSTIWTIFQKTIINFFFYSSISNYSLILLMVLFNDPKQLNFWAYYTVNYFLFSFLFFFLLYTIEKKFFNFRIIFINELNHIKKINIWYKAPLMLILIILMGFPIFPIFLGKFYFIYVLFNTFNLSFSIFTICCILINILLTFFYFILLLKIIYIDDYQWNNINYKLIENEYKNKRKRKYELFFKNKKIIENLKLELIKKGWSLEELELVLFNNDEINFLSYELEEDVLKLYQMYWKVFVILIFIFSFIFTIPLFNLWFI